MPVHLQTVLLGPQQYVGCRVATTQGRATIEMNISLKTARDNGVTGGTLRIVRTAFSQRPSCPAAARSHGFDPKTVASVS